MQALFFLRKEKRWLVEKMVKEEYYEKESIIVKLMAGIHIFMLNCNPRFHTRYLG